MPQEQLMIAPTQHYPEVVAVNPQPQGPETKNLQDSLIATPEEYLQTEQEARDLQQALALDFDIMASQMPLEELQRRAKPAIDIINQRRPNDPLSTESTSRQFLQHVIRPVWHEHFPADDSQEALSVWQGFVGQWSEHIQDSLEELRANGETLRRLASNKEVMTQVADIRTEKIEIMRAASSYLGADLSVRRLAKQEVAVRTQAALSGRGLLPHEVKKIDAIAARQQAARQQQNEALSSPEVVDEIQRRKALKDIRDLERGLLLTDTMQATIDYVLPSLMSGAPVLLVGETGGAKTALAEYVSNVYFGQIPELISGHSELNSYQLVGKMSIKDGQTEFDPGPMLRAMEQGKPIILDEINAIDANFMKRLNKIMQLRPGDVYIPQEDSGREVKIMPGFCIIATANEKSKRYKGVDDLSVEFQNRFGANIVRIGYPDANVPDGQPPVDNMRLALSFLRDRGGHLDPRIDPKELGRFVRAAHVTQKIFSGSDVPSYVDSSVVRDGVKEAVIAPRTMIDILSKVKEGQSFNTILSHFVSGLKHVGDRAAIKAILEANGFEIDG